MDLEELARALPKAELHLHIEGTLEPEMMLALATRNKTALRFRNVADVRRAYRFRDLQSFLDVYYEGASVLRTERDFHDLAWAYLEKAAAQGVRHAELFFDPQTHTERGVPIGAVVRGLEAALKESEAALGVSGRLILCFLRHLPAEAADKTLTEALPFLDKIAAVGLDSGEKGNPPRKFERVFARARAKGLKAVAHAGEEGPAAYVAEALDVLKASRIDHGVRCAEDPALVERLAREGIPLTMCPLSNVKLKVFPRLEDHNLAKLLERGLAVTVNSDDPAYFGGYILDNYVRTAQALRLSGEQLICLARNSIHASFLPPAEKKPLLEGIMEIEARHEKSDRPGGPADRRKRPGAERPKAA